MVFGALSLWIGLLLIVFGPTPEGGYLRRAASEGIAIGIILILVGFAVRRATRPS